MDKIKAIQIIEKYKGVGRLLGVVDDEAILDEIIQMIDNLTENQSIPNNANAKTKGKYGESEYQRIISEENTDLSEYYIAPSIISRREDIQDYWHSLKDEEKSEFTIFELNIILHLISKQYKKYQKKDKKRIITMVNNAVKDKRMKDSYDNIVV